MIEVEEATKEIIKLPKNIRQIGNPSENWKIYVEDYVHTYLHAGTEEERKSRKVCILLGRILQADKKYIFISGAIAIEPMKDTSVFPGFTDQIWEYIYQQMKAYFDDLEIVGWSVETSFWPLHLTMEFEKIHRRYFEGAGKVMLLTNADEQEEKFYQIQNGNLTAQGGYYVYYEKNQMMQNFMVQQYQKVESNFSEKIEEKNVVSSYRAIINEKKESKMPTAEHSILCAAGVLTVLAACVIGITSINNYEKMKSIQAAIQVLSSSVEQESEISDTQTMKVQDIESNIEPLPTTGDASQNAASDQTAQPAQTEPEQQADQPQINESQEQVQQPVAVEQPQAQPEQVQAPTEPAMTEAQTYLLQGYYIVQQGENLAGISQKIYQNKDMVSQICQKNGIEDENTIYAGQKLLLP